MIRLLSTTLICLLVSLQLFARNNPKKKLTREQYIASYAKVAVEEMNRYHIPASITMAQACLESGNGNSTLSVKANNHFGIKGNNGWTGPYVKHNDDRRGERFRKYNSAWESFRDHSKFLTENPRYGFLFNLKVTDYKGWARGLKKAGYATDPKYPTRLITIIEAYDLHELDKQYTPAAEDLLAENPFAKTEVNDAFVIDAGAMTATQQRNGLKSILPAEGVSYDQIAQKYGVKKWEIYHYNDAVKGMKPVAGVPVYLQMKRSKGSKSQKFHRVKVGESMWQIAQRYGIRLKSLYKLNRMPLNQRSEVDQVLWLSKRKPKN